MENETATPAQDKDNGDSKPVVKAPANLDNQVMTIASHRHYHEKLAELRNKNSDDAGSEAARLDRIEKGLDTLVAYVSNEADTAGAKVGSKLPSGGGIPERVAASAPKARSSEPKRFWERDTEPESE